MPIPLSRRNETGSVDVCRVEPTGLIALEGWSIEPDLAGHELPAVWLDEVPVPVHEVYRTHRPDVAGQRGGGNEFLGFTAAYFDPAAARDPRQQRTLRIAWRGARLLEEPIRFPFVSPHYGDLMTTTEVLHREHIYGQGPPSPRNCESVVAAVRSLPGPVLDFGCGSGFLVKMFRQAGVEAHGIEVDGPLIRDHLHEEVRPYITLYDGQFPLPYPDNFFRSSIASEVIEHIPDFETALAELARVTRERCVVTVPDISAIPVGFPHGVVPWHLLEATHVNFFNARSLRHCLSRHFAKVALAKIGPRGIGDTTWYTSLLVTCEKST